MFVKIVQVMPVVSRNYTDRMGANQEFRSMGLIVDSGNGTMYVEAVQELCAELEKLQLKSGDCSLIQVASVAREYKTSSGDTRYSNEFTIKRFVLV